MPEGHTIHRIANRHRDLFAGETVRVTSPQGRFADGARRVDGRVLENVEARGKHLFYHWEGRRTIHVHLGLVGKFRAFSAPAPEPTPATRLAIKNETGAAYLSGPMTCELVDASQVEKIVGHLGPDPLQPGTRSTEFASRLSTQKKPIGEVLLDQSVIAGIGNVYRAEVLYLCGIDPRTPADALSDEQVRCIWTTTREELRRGLGDGRIITVRPRDVGAARRSELPEQLQRYVYKRQHRPCLRCRTTISATRLGGRETWWCPSCQT